METCAVSASSVLGLPSMNRGGSVFHSLALFTLILVCDSVERSGDYTALPQVDADGNLYPQDPVFYGAQGRYIVTNEAAGARCAVPADFDGDGDMDLVSVSSEDNTVAWYERLADGTYGPKQMISKSSNGARIVTVGDMDNDGVIDIIVASYYDHTVGWFRNLGGGSFGNMQVITQNANNGQGVSVADLDNDGDLDVLSASSGDNTVAWYENLGEGKFCEVKKVVDSAAAGVRTAIAADFNQDGWPDIASAMKDDNMVAWYVNNQNGTFTKIPIDTQANGAYSLFAADVDGDGIVDLVDAANAEGMPVGGTEGGKVNWFKNDGNGVFTKIAVTADGDNDWFVLSVWAGDLDGDGDVDIASASFALTHDGGISWYENLDGIGTSWTRHQPYKTVGLSKTGHYIFGADMDGDGDNDLIAVTNADNKVQILTAQTSCTNSPPTTQSCCTADDQYWDGAACQTCAPGTYVVTGGGSCATCPGIAPADCDLPNKGLLYQPRSCWSMPPCDNYGQSIVECDCFANHYLDMATSTCAHCPDGQLTVDDVPRTGNNYTFVTGVFTDQTTYAISDYSWTGFQQSRCFIPECPGGLFFSLDVLTCTQCEAGAYSLTGSQTACTPCPAGSECGAGSGNPIACQAGSYSPISSSSCTPSPTGYFVAAAQMGAPVACDPGKIAPNTGRASCDSCDIGKFASAPGMTACTDCASILPGSTTNLLGASSSDECICAEGLWLGITSSECTTCPEGVNCTFRNATGLVAPGYYAEPSDFAPTFKGAWKCVNSDLCPGGPPGDCCSGGQVDIGCARCANGFTLADGECVECTGGNKSLVFIVLVIVLVLCLVAYYKILNKPLKVTVPITTGIGISMASLVMTVQVLGIFNRLSVPWSSGVDNGVSVLSIFVLDLEQLSPECSLGTNPVSMFTARCLVPFILAIWIAMVFGATKVLGMVKSSWAWDINYTFNTLLGAFNCTFIVVVGQAVVPLVCYSHPNGKLTVQDYPSIVCFDGNADWTGLITWSVILVMLVIVPYMATVVWGMCKAKSELSAQRLHLIRFQCLINRFRPDVQYWGMVVMVLQLALAFSPMVDPDDPIAQVIYIICVLVAYNLACALATPWKTVDHNFLDMSTMFLLCIMVLLNAPFMGVSSSQDAYMTFQYICFLGQAILYLGFFVRALYYVATRGVKGNFGYEYPRNAKAMQELVGDFDMQAKHFAGIGQEEMTRILSSLHTYDRLNLRKTLNILSAAMASVSQGQMIDDKADPTPQFFPKSYSKDAINRSITKHRSSLSDRSAEPINEHSDATKPTSSPCLVNDPRAGTKDEDGFDWPPVPDDVENMPPPIVDTVGLHDRAMSPYTLSAGKTNGTH